MEDYFKDFGIWLVRLSQLALIIENFFNGHVIPSYYKRTRIKWVLCKLNFEKVFDKVN